MYIFQELPLEPIEYVLPSQLGQCNFPGAGQYQIACNRPASYLERPFQAVIGQSVSVLGVPDGKLGPIGGF